MMVLEQSYTIDEVSTCDNGDHLFQLLGIAVCLLDSEKIENISTVINLFD